jgi:serine/threonine protein kinase
VTEGPLIHGYRIGPRIGRGGTGEVYQAERIPAGPRVAVKFVRRGPMAHSATRSQFVARARAVEALRSRHIVKVIEVCGEAPWGPFMVMELLEGDSLARWTAEGRRPEQLVAVAMQICRGLEVAHARGVVHRDLSPANVFICGPAGRPTTAKILDFGIARLVADGGTRASTAILVRQGDLLGTAAYMPPEQIRDPATVDARADLYAVGAILYEALGAGLPHPGTTRTEVVYHALSQRATPLAWRCPHLPAGLAAAVERALDPQPSRRFETAGQLRQALAPFALRLPR